MSSIILYSVFIYIWVSLTFWKLSKKWFDYERHPLYMPLFWLRTDWQLVTDQQPLSCNQSPIIQQLVTGTSQQIASLSPYVWLTVADRSPINCWQVEKPIADYSAIIISFQIWALRSQRSPVSCNEIGCKQIVSRSQPMCDWCFMGNFEEIHQHQHHTSHWKSVWQGPECSPVQ